MALAFTLFSAFRSWAAGDAPPSVGESEPVLQLPAGDKPAFIDIQPRRCLLRANQNECRTQLVVTWHTDKNTDVCLYEGDEQLELACWENAVRGATKVSFVGSEDTNYSLKNKQGLILVDAVFVVGMVEKNRHKPHFRKRRMWGFP